LAAGSVAAAASRRKTRTAVCGVLTTDGEGRDRFATAGGEKAAAAPKAAAKAAPKAAAKAAAAPKAAIAPAAGLMQSQWTSKEVLTVGIPGTSALGAPHIEASSGAAVKNDTPYTKRYWPKYPEEVKGDIGIQLGATLPMSQSAGMYWDPLGMSADGDMLSFRRRREAEIKNGRVAMIACIGYITAEYVRWPGYCSPSNDLKFTDIPNGLAALYKIPAEGWAQIGVFVAFLELFPLRQDKERPAGDYKTCGKLGVPWFFVAGRAGTDSDQEGNGKSLNAEINNGRLAMLAISGMVAQNAFFGSTGASMWIPGQ